MPVPILRQFIDGHHEAFCDLVERNERVSVIELVRGDSKELIEYCNALGYRTLVVDANTCSFNCANVRRIQWLFAYRGANFNICPPPKQTHCKCVYDVLKDIPDSDHSYPLIPKEHYDAIKLIPSGWTYSYLMKYGRLLNVPSIDVNYRRLCWYSAALLFDGEVPIHPGCNRPLTHDENIAIMRDTSDVWINQLVGLFLKDHWKDSDYESEYCATFNRWDGENTPGKLNKECSIYAYGVRDYLPHNKTLPHIKFDPAKYAAATKTNDIEDAFNSWQIR